MINQLAVCFASLKTLFACHEMKFCNGGIAAHKNRAREATILVCDGVLHGWPWILYFPIFFAKEDQSTNGQPQGLIFKTSDIRFWHRVWQLYSNLHCVCNNWCHQNWQSGFELCKGKSREISTQWHHCCSVGYLNDLCTSTQNIPDNSWPNPKYHFWILAVGRAE